jgi:hypothetical protein
MDYDKGGVLAPAFTVARNDSGAPIPVWTAEQVARVLAWAKGHYATGTFQCPEPQPPDPAE